MPGRLATAREERGGIGEHGVAAPRHAGPDDPSPQMRQPSFAAIVASLHLRRVGMGGQRKAAARVAGKVAWRG